MTLEPTAALVMRWAAPSYDNGVVRKYLQHLDLSSGNDLFAQCNAVCEWYGEVILNRKNLMKHLVEQRLRRGRSQYQLLFLAAGQSPLALQIIQKYYSKVSSIFEIDIAGMKEKKDVYSKVVPQFSDKLHCIDGDITSDRIPALIHESGSPYSSELPSIILVEGISYYLSRQELQTIIIGFRSESARHFFIVEYLIPYTYVNRIRRFIPRQIFRIIQRSTGLETITCYTKEELDGIFQRNGGKLVAHYYMTDMERLRTGVSRYFPNPGDGWIECIVAET